VTALGHEERFPPPRLSDRCGIRKRSFAGDYPGHLDIWIRLSLGTMRTAHCKKSQADAIKTAKFSAHDSVTPPDTSIISDAASHLAAHLGRRLIFAEAFIDDLAQ
jgi:hypothetical protein